MKKIVGVSMLLLSGSGFTSPIIASSTRAGWEITFQAEKNQIKPDDLPTPVKQTIVSDESLKEYPVSEAWQIKGISAQITYEVAFDNGTADKLWKTYDPQGKEITE